MVEDFIICHDELEKHLGPHVDTLLWLEDDLVLMDNFFPSLTSIMTLGRGRLGMLGMPPGWTSSSTSTPD